MKRWISLLLCVMLAAAAAGCGNEGTAGKISGQAPGVKEILEAEMAKEDEKKKGQETGSQSEVIGQSEAGDQDGIVGQSEGGDQEGIVGQSEGGDQDGIGGQSEAGSQSGIIAQSEAGDQDGFGSQSGDGSREEIGGQDGSDGQDESPDQSAGSSEENGYNGRQTGVDEGAPEPEPVSESEREAFKSEGIDVDLTALSSTMVYAEVYNMLIAPESYIGKTVKMEGMFASAYDAIADQRYYACIISDATACCSQGIEFDPAGDYSYPEDYPAEGENVCVVGVFDVYQEGDYDYCTLRNAVLV